MLRLAVAFAIIAAVHCFRARPRCTLQTSEQLGGLTAYCVSGLASGQCPTGLTLSQEACTGSDNCCIGDVCSGGNSVCNNNGNCTDDGTGYASCDCDPGFSGDFCETEPCDPVCVSGTCNGGTCECDDGFSGDDCSVDACAPANSQCNDTGTNECVRVAYPVLFQCDCLDGFDGELCDTDACAPDNSQCEASNTNECVRLAAPDFFRCDCLDGFHGDFCETDACDPAADPCVNGNCTRTGTDPYYECMCEEPFFGDNCDQEICDNNPCENMGTCESLTENTYQCACIDDYTGENCTVPVCVGDNSECNFNGVCEPIGGGDYRCDCSSGNYGDACQFVEPLCGSEVASRIAFGQDATEAEQPWVVAFSSSDTIMCTGTLIGRNYALTGRHCALLILEDRDTVYATVGQHNSTGTDIDEVTLTIANITFMDRNYESLTAYLNDRFAGINNGLADALVLVEFEEDLTYGFAVNRACPPTNTFDVSSTCRVSAWGFIEGDARPSVKQTEDAFLVDSERSCGYMLGNGNSPPSNVACSLLDALDAGGCEVDQGGPVVCQDPDTSRWHVQGIMLYYPNGQAAGGPYCGNQLTPYIDLYSAWSFVEDNTGISLA